MKVLGVIQARSGSTRLPRKVLLPLAGRPAILQMLDRVARCGRLDELWLATSTASADDELASVVEAAGYPVFRGSEDDVLDRFYRLAKARQADLIVRLTGDCPLHDPAVIDEVVDAYLGACPPVSYASNCETPTFPDGLDAEVLSFDLLEQLALGTTHGPDREHVTLGIYRNGRTGAGPLTLCVRAPADFSHLRWTLDHPEDYAFIQCVYDALYFADPCFSWMEVMAWLTKNPGAMALNGHFSRNEQLALSSKSADDKSPQGPIEGRP